jgi:hypothetical protein
MDDGDYAAAFDAVKLIYSFTYFRTNADDKTLKILTEVLQEIFYGKSSQAFYE